jgi:hypothetical protein
MSFRESYFSNFILKASRYGEFNDPFDLVLGEYGRSLSDKDAEEFYDSMPGHYRTIEYHDETYLNIQTGPRASVAILCFSETFDNILMWTHYADEHAGVCVGYDADCDFFNTEHDCEYSENVGELRPVIYTEERPQFFLPCDLVNDTSDWFKKSIVWHYEKEHRILLPIDKAKTIATEPETIWGYKVNPMNIKKIIMGCRMNSAHKQYIRETLKAYNVEIIESKPHPSHYKLNFQAYDPKKDVDPRYNLGMDV